MTKREREELKAAAWREACVCYPVVTYAMEIAAALIDPAADPVTDEDFQAVYRCPFELVERERKNGGLRRINDHQAERLCFFLDVLRNAEREDFEAVAGIDPEREKVSNGATRDMKLARFATRQAQYQHWADLIESLADVEKCQDARKC